MRGELGRLGGNCFDVAGHGRRPDGDDLDASRAPDLSAASVGVFLTHLLRRLALADPTIQPMADGLQALETLAFGGGVGRQWKPADVFSEELLRHLPHRLDQRSTDWRALYV